MTDNHWYNEPGVVEFGKERGGHPTIFLHGPSGIGKTTSIDSLIKGVGKDNVLIHCTELRQYPLLKHNPYIRHCPDVTTLVQSIQFVQRLIDEKRAPMFNVLDDYTSHCDHMKQRIYTDIPDKAKSFDRWEQYADRELELLAAMRDQDTNWIILCQSNPTGVDGNGTPVYTPEVHGRKLPRRLAGLFDEYFFMGMYQDKDTQNWTRYFQTGITVADGTQCKDSMGVLDVYEPPDWCHIFSKLTGKPFGEAKQGGK